MCSLMRGYGRVGHTLLEVCAACAHKVLPAQLSFHPDSCSAPYMGPGTCDASCGRCKPCEGYVPSDFLPPPNVTAPAGDPPSASTALPVDATPVSPNQHPNPGAPNPGNTSTGFGAPAPALPPVGPVLRAPAPETGGAPAPCVADITVRSCPRPADVETLGRKAPQCMLGCHVCMRPLCRRLQQTVFACQLSGYVI